MSSLVRFDPFSDVGVARLGTRAASSLGVALDMYEISDGIVVEVAIPGIDPDDIEISVVGDDLTIKGEFKEESDQEGRQYFVRSRRFGEFSRMISLPAYVDASKTTASYDKGVLKLDVPRREETKPRQIQVKIK